MRSLEIITYNKKRDVHMNVKSQAFPLSKSSNSKPSNEETKQPPHALLPTLKKFNIKELPLAFPITQLKFEFDPERTSVYNPHVKLLHFKEWHSLFLALLKSQIHEIQLINYGLWSYPTVQRKELFLLLSRMQHANVNKLDISIENLTRHEIRKIGLLARQIEDLKLSKVFSFNENEMTAKVKTLAKYLSYFKLLRKLDLSEFLLRDKNAFPILKGLSALSLSSLDLNLNSQGDEVITYLCQQIRHMNIKNLNLVVSIIGDTGLINLGLYIQLHPALKKLSLTIFNQNISCSRERSFETEGIIAFASSLKKAQLESLHLNCDTIDQQEIKALLTNLPPTLKKINLKLHTVYSHVDCLMLDVGPEKLRHVEEFILKGWELSDKSANKIAELIASGQLKTLDLRGSESYSELRPITEKVKKILLTAADSPFAHPHLTILAVDKNSKSDYSCNTVLYAAKDKPVTTNQSPNYTLKPEGNLLSQRFFKRAPFLPSNMPRSKKNNDNANNHNLDKNKNDKKTSCCSLF